MRSGSGLASTTSWLSIEEGRFQKVKSLDGGTLVGAAIAITEDREHNIWASVVGAQRKLLRIWTCAVQEEFQFDRIKIMGERWRRIPAAESG